MIKKLFEILSGLPATIVAGVFLLLDLIPHLSEEFGWTIHHAIFLPFDPAWVTILICGYPLLYLAIWRLIYNPGIKKISSALLISIAMFAAIAIGDLFAAGEVAFIMSLGAILEEKTTEKAKNGLKKLISLAPQQGRKITDNQEEMIPAEQIQVGDILRVLPGESIPVDGEIIRGESSVDQSIMTGESLPVDKTVGDSVYCGTINRFGTMDIQASKVGEDSSLQRLIRMVQDAENNQAPMQRIADQWASYLVPIALLIAILGGLWKNDIIVAVTILVVFCPCALVLATPTAIMAAIGQATKHGVIIKSGEALEKMGKVDTIAFDKTGTLTFGKLEVSDILSFDKNISSDRLLSLVASVESHSEHPLGKAIVEKAKVDGATIFEIENFQMQAGMGIRGIVDEKNIFCGNEKYLLASQITISEEISQKIATLRSQGKASVLAAIDNICVGIVALSDTIRPDAQEVVVKLASLGAKTLLLTGDNEQTASYFASQTGMKSVNANLLPEEKVAHISELQKNGAHVCMIGDGVNDAPALKIAEVGVAMGAMGSDIAIEAADIALMNDDITKILYLKKLADATAKTIKFSISLSIFINLAAIFLSLMKLLTPTTGALVHNVGSCLVVLIAAMLCDRKF